MVEVRRACGAGSIEVTDSGLSKQQKRTDNMLKDVPYFSILIPCYNRPLFARDAIISAINQTCADFEVIISNNGSNAEVLESIKDLIKTPRVRYFETNTVLSMPDHWEFLRSLAIGKYVLVLTDRSILKQNALAKLKSIHVENPGSSNIVSWGWDIYYNSEQILFKYKGNGSSDVINSLNYLICAARYKDKIYPYALPRGLNSCASSDIMKSIAGHCKSVFGRINPDYSFGYRCLHEVDEFVHINGSLMISQGLSSSNGGKSQTGDAGSYLRSLGLTVEEAFDKVPVKLSFVEASIAQDLLKTFDVYENSFGLSEFNIAGFYIRCINELEVKKIHMLLPNESIKNFEKVIFSSLQNENPLVKDEVMQYMHSYALKRFRFTTFLQRCLINFPSKRLRVLYLLARGGVMLDNVHNEKIS